MLGKPEADTWEREVLVLPMNGRREDAVTVVALETHTGILRFFVTRSDGVVDGYATEREAFSAALASAAWNLKAVTPRR